MDPEEKDIEFVDFSDRTMEEAEAEMQSGLLCRSRCLTRR